MKKLILSALSLILTVLIFTSCDKTDTDLMTASVKTGGILSPLAAFPYKLGETTNFDVTIDIPKGPGIVSIDVYKKYTGKAEVLDQTVQVGSVNATQDASIAVSYNYVKLTAGLISMPANEALLAIGDAWTLRFVSTMEDGRKVEVGPKSIISVANKYAGFYQCVGYFTHPVASSSRPINEKKFLVPLTAFSCQIPAGDLGSSGYSVDIVVDPVTNAVTFKNGVPVDILGSTALPSYFEPSTGKFYLHYFYVGGSGNRVIDEVYTPII